MPSIFSRKKSSARAQARPPSGVPADFGHSRGGMSQLAQNDTPESAMPPPRQQQPPPPVQKDPPFASPPGAGEPGSVHFGPGYGVGAPIQQQQSVSLPDARQRQFQQQQQQQQQYMNGNSVSDIAINGSNGYIRNNEKPLPAPQHQQQRPPSNGNSSAAPANGRAGEPVTRSSSGSSSFWSKRTLNGQPMFPRRGFSAALHDQLVHWFGGKSDSGLQNDLNTMDSTSWEVRRVEAVGSVPSPREGHAATFIGRTMFVFGGQDISGKYDESLYAYNTGNLTWYKVPMRGSALAGRKGHTAVSVGSKLYVFGGTADGYFMNDLVSFNVRKAADIGAYWTFENVVAAPGEQETLMPPPRAGHSSSVHLESIFVFGGMDSERCYNDLWEFSLTTNTWSRVTPNGATPPARYGHASAVVDDCIVIMGGRTLRGEPLNDFFAYKVSSQRWYTFQVNSSTWPHQIDPIFSLVKTRLLLYSGSMLRDEQESLIYSLDTSKIKIQPDAPRPQAQSQPQAQARPQGSLPAPPQQQQQQHTSFEEDIDALDKSRRHRSMMPPSSSQGMQQQLQSAQRSPPTAQQSLPASGTRAVSMVGNAAAERAVREQQGFQNGSNAGRSTESGIPLPPSSAARQQQQQSAAPTIDTSRAAQGNPSLDSFEVISAPLGDDSDVQRTAATNSSWASQGSKGRGGHRKSIVLNQNLVNSNVTGSPPVGAVNMLGSNASLGAISNDSLAGAQQQALLNPQVQQAKRDDQRLTIQLRNRNSVAILSSGGETPEMSSDDVAAAAASRQSEANGMAASVAASAAAANGAPSEAARAPAQKRMSTDASMSSEHKDAVTRAWAILEDKYAHQRLARQDGDTATSSLQNVRVGESLLSDDASRVLGVLLGMRRELAETKQQLSTVSRVAIERVAEAESGRKSALQEAIYLKAKASALTAGNAPLLNKLNMHRIHELERLYANTLNDNDALRNQLANANLALKQSHDALAEFKSDAELTRRQLRELEALHAEEQQQAPRVAADLERRLGEKDAAIAQLAAADAERAQRLDAAMQQAQAAQERAERVQEMHADALARLDTLGATAAELRSEVDVQRAHAERARERAADFERLWSESRDELAAFRGLRAQVDQLAAKEQRIAELEQRLADAPGYARPRNDSNTSDAQAPRASFSSHSSETRAHELHAAYLAAHRQWSEARDELLSLKNALREANDQRHEADARVAARERELSDMQARLSAFTALLQEYAERQQRGAGDARQQGLRGDDDAISVQSMLAAIQQLQRTSSIATTRASIDAVKPSPAVAPPPAAAVAARGLEA